MQPSRKVRGPSPARRKSTGAPPPDQQRLTLTMTQEDMDALQKVADTNLRSMSAQALFYIRSAMMRELREQQAVEA